MVAVVLVEDDPPFAEELIEFLGAHGIDAVWLKSLAGLMTVVSRRPPDLLVLDQFVGGQDALTLLPELRRRYSGGVLVLTGNQDPADRIVALETGADDFVAKSLGPRELLARLRAVLRRVSPPPLATAPPAPTGKWLIDARRNKVQAPGGALLRLTHTELQMLVYLVSNPGRLITRDELSSAVLHRRFLPEDRSVDNMLSRIRGTLKPHVADERLIRSVRGIGYVFAGLDLAEESLLQPAGEAPPRVVAAADSEGV